MSSWKRTYWVVWTANLTTAVGMMSFLPFFPSHLKSLGLTDPNEIAAGTGVIFGAAPLAIALSSMAGGFLSRYLGLRGLFLLGAVVLVVSLLRSRPARGA